jgi:hypothetical protein
MGAATKVEIRTPGGETIDATAAFAAMDYNEVEFQRVQTLVTNLLNTHWRGILQAVADSEDSTGSVSISVKLDHSGPARIVKTKLSYAVKTSDEAEAYVQDPAQKELDL